MTDTRIEPVDGTTVGRSDTPLPGSPKPAGSSATASCRPSSAPS